MSEQQPAEREILDSYPVSGQIFFRQSSNEWVLELTGSINGTTFTARHTQPADTRPEDVAGLPALYEPTPDAEGLVLALTELCDEIDKHGMLVLDKAAWISWLKRKIRKARKTLAAYHKQGG